MKICCNCKIEKPLYEYHKRSNRPCGYRSRCKECCKIYKTKRRDGYRREYELMKAYSMTIEDYNNMLNEQNGKCKICGNGSEGMKRKKFLCVDHNHETGKVRGLLCDKCNRGIGLLNDDLQTLKSAIKYLENK